MLNMAYLQGVDRNQTSYLITSLDNIIDESNPVRVIDAFVNFIDMEKMGFIIYDPKKPGQCPYNREELLKLHIYGYVNGIRSSRKMEKEAQRNLEIMWLINSLIPDHGTISSFMKENKNAFRKVLKEFTLLLKGWGLIDGKLIAIDGTKLKAQNSKHNYITETVFQKKLEYVDEQIEEYLKQLEKNDSAERSEVTLLPKDVETIQNKLTTYSKMKNEYQELKDKLKESNIKQVCLVDSEARGMKNNGKFEVCYNVQTSVDGKNNLVIDSDVVNDINDLNQLSNMTFRAKSILRKRKMAVLADTGYYNAEKIKECIDKKITLYIKKSKANNQTGENQFRKEKFIYQVEKDVYICPERKELIFTEYTTKKNLRYKRYKCSNCNDCSKKPFCTTAKEGRNLQRWIFEDTLEHLAEDTLAHNETYKQRRCIVEHPFGTIKRAMGYTYFLRKGLASVNAEAASIFIAYNLKRIINILTVPVLLKKFSQLSRG